MKIKRRKIVIFGIPSCFGGNMQGCEKGPDAIRKYLIPFLKKKQISYKDIGNVPVPKNCVIKDPTKKCLPEIQKLYRNFEKFFQQHKLFDKNIFPVLLGGDHSVNFSFIQHAVQKKRIGLIWFDAHGDFNTPHITPSGNIHGMVLSALTGRGLHKAFGVKQTLLQEKNICIFGTRDLDIKEKKLLSHTKIKVFTMKEIQKNGLKKSLQQAVKVASAHTEGFHLSFDLDVINQKIAPEVGTPVQGGLTKKDLKILTTFLQTQPILSFDVVELYPRKNKKNATAKLAAELIMSLIVDGAEK